eukprot:2178215-Amphidinium_carterae.1
MTLWTESDCLWHQRHAPGTCKNRVQSEQEQFVGGCRVFSPSDVTELMTNASLGQDLDDIACQWVRQNEDTWSNWCASEKVTAKEAPHYAVFSEWKASCCKPHTNLQFPHWHSLLHVAAINDRGEALGLQAIAVGTCRLPRADECAAGWAFDAGEGRCTRCLAGSYSTGPGDLKT